MTFVFETVYDKKTLSALAKGLRKTVRKKHSRRSRRWGIVVMALGLLLPFLGQEGFSLEGRTLLSWLTAAIVGVALIWEDELNGWLACRKMLPGTEKARTVFEEEGYTTTTDAGQTRQTYDRVDALAETEGYFILVFGNNHAQAYAKAGLVSGTEEEFRAFIREKTGKDIRQI